MQISASRERGSYQALIEENSYSIVEIHNAGDDPLFQSIKKPVILFVLLAFYYLNLRIILRCYHFAIISLQYVSQRYLPY
jgi:hypothetical protein